MSSTHVANVVATAISRLPQEFQKDVIKRFITSLLTEAQNTEDVVYELVELRMLGTAANADLDAYGTLVGEAREGLGDEEYRKVLRVKILSNRSNGQTETLISIVSRLTGSEDVRIIDVYPAGIEVCFTIDPPLTAAQRRRLYRFVHRSKSAGVRLDGIVEGRVGYFGFAKNPNSLGFDQGRYGSLIS